MESAMLRILAEHGQAEMEKVGFRFRGEDAGNPILQVIAAHTMQAPPPNLPMLSSLYAQKLEKDLRRDLEVPDPIDEMEADPLHQENKRLRRITQNMRSKMEMIRMQREMARIQGEVSALQGVGAGMAPNPAAAAAGGGLPPEAGGIPPEAAAAAAAQQGAPAPNGPPVGGAPASAPQAPPGAPSMGVGPVEAASM
jgi:hypothetical protein